jgi:hypothetical protein
MSGRRRWAERLTLVILLLSLGLLLVTSTPLFFQPRQAHAARPFIGRAVRAAGLLPMGPWDDEDARSAIGASRAGNSIDASRYAAPATNTREIAVVLKPTSLRAEAGHEASKLVSLGPGSVLLVIRKRDGWLLVANTSGDALEVGWVPSDSVKRLPYSPDD